MRKPRALALLLLILAACSNHAASSVPDSGLDANTTDALGPFDPQVDAADVSILYPLDPFAKGELVNADETAAYGQLLPENIVPGMPYPLDVDGGSYADLRVVGVRLDPCSARGGCSSEVRVVYQPIVAHTVMGEAADGAVHVFYAVPADELRYMLEQILALKKAYGAGIAYGDKLGPQPILAATGNSGAYAQGLHAILLAHLGEQRIERVTFLLHVFPDQDAWQFALFERVASAFVARSIINVTSPSQEILGNVAFPDQLGGIEQDAQSTPTLPGVAVLASASRPAQATPAVVAGFASAVDAQNPMKHTSEDTDCGSCHLAEGARRAGTQVYGLTPTAPFTSARSLDYVRDSIAVTNFHAFGYLGTSISVMQRTANESALVADRMQAELVAH